MNAMGSQKMINGDAKQVCDLEKLSTKYLVKLV